MRSLTPLISRLAHRINPKLGKIYDSNPVFWNDGLVGFVIGVPLTWIMYQPLAPYMAWFLQLPFYVVCAFVSFCIQHIFRRKWVFKEMKVKS